MAPHVMPRIPLADLGSIAEQLRARRASMPDLARALLDWALLCHARSRERRVLAALDDRALRDIGLPRDAVRRETGKHFWQR